ncbi:MAG TPA: anthranilate synthase component I family protein, partial [Candidatus Wirthbacteria bacterium]|nr:anthranilate synthase component I family protein [Candidatus Wirthbacteria bacterium]
GDVFQVVLSMQFHYRLRGNYLLIYDQLRQINPSPYLSYIKFGQREIITSSVDLVVRLRNDSSGLWGARIENFPLAGTTIRGQTPEEDESLFEQLVNDEKERAEHIMLVDLGRNDVGRVCNFGSVQVTQFMVPKRFSHVQHIESKIEGEVREDKDMFDCLRATAPMGTVTGAPKIEAMRIINNLEKNARGPYSGELGGFGLNGECIFSVGLRSLFISGEIAYTQVGSGIVHDSTPDYEYREIMRKSNGMLRAIKEASKI